MKNETAIVSDTKADQAYRRIKEAILRGEAAPGEKLVVHKLAKMYNTSIIPIREAVSRLEAEELVRVVPHTGIYVKGIDLDRLKELYPIRGVLEGYAVRLSADLCTPADFEHLKGLIDRMEESIKAGDAASMGELNQKFHMSIYRISGNVSLVKMIDDLWQKTILARLIFKFTPQRSKVSNREHRIIVECLETGKPRKAEKLIIRQSEKTLELLERHLKKNE